MQIRSRMRRVFALVSNIFVTAGTGYIGGVKLRNVVRAIANAVDSPPDGVRIIENPELRRA